MSVNRVPVFQTFDVDCAIFICERILDLAALSTFKETEDKWVIVFLRVMDAWS